MIAAAARCCGCEAAEHAFKTPGLREIGRSAPYMHDGSLATLDDVVRHYENGVVDALDAVAKDIPHNLELTDDGARRTSSPFWAR